MPRTIDIGINNPALTESHDLKDTIDLILLDLLRKSACKRSLSVEKLTGTGRERKIVKARVEFCREVRNNYPEVTLKHMGRVLNKDHSSIYYYLNCYKDF